MAFIEMDFASGGGGTLDLSVSLTPLVPKLTSNTANVISNGQYSSSYASYMAFDGNDSTRWASPANTAIGAYIGYDFNAPKIIKAVYVYNYSQVLASTVKAFDFEVWDGNNWVKLPWDEAFTIPQASASVICLVNPQNKAYSKARIVITENYGNTDSTVWTLQFYGYDA